ncbi:MAG: hypothetical protein HYZ14_14660 [Bacteroidetes bacterium]|nr:hypothetical protein [Bacteroidota bacterium]
MTDQKKHIVLLTTWFPPLQSVAVNRMVSIARYLDYTKFNLTVITAGTKNNQGWSTENGYRIYRVKPQGGFAKPEFKSSDSRFRHKLKVAWRIIRLRLMGDEDRFWSKKAAQVLENLQQQTPVDLVLSSFSPVAPHLVALAFKKKYPGVKWIVDMRDEMSLNPQSNQALRKYYASVEKDIAGYANALISVSQPIVDYFKTVIPGLTTYVEIRNGYDHEMPETNPAFNTCLTFLHAGSFYGTRKPDTFFAALLNLHRKKQLPQNWKFICAGAARNFSIPAEFEQQVEWIERVSQADSINLMLNADINVLIQPPTGRMGVYTGKLFDYLSVCKPVLAIVDTRDVAAALIKSVNAGYVASFDNVQSIETALIKAIENWEKKQVPEIDIPQIRSLHRKIQIQKLNLLIDHLLNES